MKRLLIVMLMVLCLFCCVSCEKNTAKQEFENYCNEVHQHIVLFKNESGETVNGDSFNHIALVERNNGCLELVFLNDSEIVIIYYIN